MRAEPRTRNAFDTTLKFAIRAHAKQTKDPDVQRTEFHQSVTASMRAISMSCITWSSRPCTFILIPGCHEGAIATGWLSICYLRSTAMPYR
jgi:hypothetical protein